MPPTPVVRLSYTPPPGLAFRKTRGRHEAPSTRPVVLPALLLSVSGAAFTGLALRTPDAAPTTVEAASSTALPAPATLAVEGSVGGPDLLQAAAAPATPVAPAVPKVTVQPLARARGAAPAPAAAAPVEAAATPERASRGGARSGAYARPTSGSVTSGFGQRWGRLHAGLDFGAPTGTPIKAVADAVVSEVKGTGSSGGYGNLVILEHADGTLTYYAHMSKVMATEGERVAAGETIGLVGSTGNSTGPHLHFEVHPGGGGAINPRPWLADRGIDV